MDTEQVAYVVYVSKATGEERRESFRMPKNTNNAERVSRLQVHLDNLIEEGNSIKSIETNYNVTIRADGRM